MVHTTAKKLTTGNAKFKRNAPLFGLIAMCFASAG